MRQLSNDVLQQIFDQSSDDPFLTLLTLSHASFSTLYFVNNTEAIVSRGTTYEPFPMKIALPTDDGESLREVVCEFDNVSLELIEELRSVTDFIDVKLEMILASKPDIVEIEIGELKLKNINYNKKTIQGRLFMDDFLNTGMTSERYLPSSFPGIFS